ncbi:hypothetical protein N7512_001866 [Penicillium capsulatum]|nr:hypothetical protein N7512_001866 [Penicillium capsulatum]
MEDPPVASEPHQIARWQVVGKRAIRLLLHQWLLIGIGVACVLAYFFPSVAKHGGVIRSEYSVLYGVIAVIFLISGLSIPRHKLFTQCLNWRLHLLVQVISFLLIPALVLAVVHIILAGDPAGHIDRAVLAGYILTACIPTTIASNVVMTRAAGGDDAAALVEVLLANTLGPFVTAAWTVTLLPRTAAFDPWRYGGGSLGSMYKDVFQQLGLSVLLPLFSVAFVVLFNIALYILLTVICFVGSRPPPIFASRRWSRPIFKPMSPEETIAVCFCGPAKSTALGIPLLYAMWAPVDLFTKAKTSVPVLLYTTEQICVAHFFVQLFRRWHTRMTGKPDVERGTQMTAEMSMADTAVGHGGITAESSMNGPETPAPPA